MKFSIIAVALVAALLGKASPIPDVDGSTGVEITAPATQDVADNAARPAAAEAVSNMELAQAVSPMLVVDAAMSDHQERQGQVCAAGLKVYGYARIADYTIYGHDFNGGDLAAKYNEGKFDNYGGPIIAGALSRSSSLPGISQAFVQSQNANYFWHKSGSVRDVIGGLSPNSGYATYVLGDCWQFQKNPAVFAKCCSSS
ncbi:hypothetical protein QFC19_002531 [Naganishia cerealis]|uniref:Uncharacterized protein n=1 Tax=Naganishia cerealis TaxID=610337 RepID=A0ACC2WA06_9TREE|nr:hypothetical protein QFC19_002531 [Naganishia cerealis]